MKVSVRTIPSRAIFLFLSLKLTVIKFPLRALSLVVVVVVGVCDMPKVYSHQPPMRARLRPAGCRIVTQV